MRENNLEIPFRGCKNAGLAYFLSQQLTPDQRRICSIPPEQFLMRPSLDDTSIFQNQDHVGLPHGGGTMADDLNGKAKHVGGKVKEGLGEVLGDRKMKREGKLAQREGEAEQDASRAQEKLEEARRQAEARESAEEGEGEA